MTYIAPYVHVLYAGENTATVSTCCTLYMFVSSDIENSLSLTTFPQIPIAIRVL